MSSPTQRTLARLKQQNLAADIVEKWIPQAKRRKDVAGCIDVLAYGGDIGVLGIQTTTGNNHAARRTKALAEPRLRTWLESGARFEIWSWTKLATGRWHLRIERILLANGKLLVVAPLVME